MTHKGYEIRYCENGHYAETREAFEGWQHKACPICKVKYFVSDRVDVTSGCICEQDSTNCPAHQTDLAQIRQDYLQCNACEGSGWHLDVLADSSMGCTCTSMHRSCPTCTGSKHSWRAVSQQYIPCPTCQGAGRLKVPVYDIEPLKTKPTEVGKEKADE